MYWLGVALNFCTAVLPSEEALVLKQPLEIAKRYVSATRTSGRALSRRRQGSACADRHAGDGSHTAAVACLGGALVTPQQNSQRARHHSQLAHAPPLTLCAPPLLAVETHGSCGAIGHRR